jgi:hypothetical protein
MPPRPGGRSRGRAFREIRPAPGEGSAPECAGAASPRPVHGGPPFTRIRVGRVPPGRALFANSLSARRPGGPSRTGGEWIAEPATPGLPSSGVVHQESSVDASPPSSPGGSQIPGSLEGPPRPGTLTSREVTGGLGRLRGADPPGPVAGRLLLRRTPRPAPPHPTTGSAGPHDRLRRRPPPASPWRGPRPAPTGAPIRVADGGRTARRIPAGRSSSLRTPGRAGHS